MKKHPAQELPVHSKINMLKAIAQIIHCLHRGDRRRSDSLIEELKTHALFLEDQIQQDVLMFAEQVCFQYDYDPWHKVTSDVQKAADRLIEDLGFAKPEEE